VSNGLRKGSVVAVLALSLVLRVGAIVAIDNPQDVPRTPAESDSPTYYVLADNLLNGTGYRYSADEAPTAKRTPGYPLFIASVFRIAGRDFNAVRGVQCVLDVISTYLVYAISLLVFRNQLAGVLAALAYALYPPALLSTTYIMTETLYTFLLLTFLATCLLAIRYRKYALYAASGIFFGLATLTRPGVLPLPYILWLLSAIWLRYAWKGFLLLALAFSVTMLPWGLRNKRDMGAFIPTSTLVGANLYKGNHLPTQGAYFTSTDSLLTDELKVRIAGTTEVERDGILRTEAITMIKANKTETAMLAIKKIPRLWFNVGYGRPPSKKSLAIAALHAAFLLLGLYGVFKTPVETRYLNMVPVTLIILSSVLHLAVAAEVRFVFPLIPVLLPYSAFGLISVLMRVRSHQ